MPRVEFSQLRPTRAARSLSAGYASMSRKIFQNVAQEFQLEPRGFSSRTQLIGTGNVEEMSVGEKKPMPGRFGE